MPGAAKSPRRGLAKSWRQLSQVSCGGLAAALIHVDTAGWFDALDREKAIVDALRIALAEIENRLGADMSHLEVG